MGTSLTAKKADGTPYLSGTKWEFYTAIQANEPVLVYRRSEKVLLDPQHPQFGEKLTQTRRVSHFSTPDRVSSNAAAWVCAFSLVGRCESIRRRD